MSTFVSGLTLGQPIGRGHFGEVFLGRDDVHGDVAVKVLSRLPGEAEADWVQRRDGLLQEAQNLARARHPNVVAVHHCVAGDDGRSIQFCMALCPRGSLLAAFDHGPMKLSAVRDVATQVTMGLQALHLRGMIHRDIKPANILLDQHGVALLGDFGLVTDRLIYGYGSVYGYRDHIAYEVWHGNATSVRTDIWALGMTLYRLLHGKRWYDRGVAPQDAVPSGGFADSLRWLPHVPKKWRRVLRRMMHDDPTSRFQNCEQLLAAFAQLPINPDWVCVVEDTSVGWSREVGARSLKVEWTQHPPNKHEWTARSEPLSTGRSRTLGRSNGKVSRSECIRGLEGFLSP